MMKNMQLLRSTFFILILFCLQTSCRILTPATEEPIPFDVYGDIESVKHIFIFLPGIKDRKESFLDENFIAIGKELIVSANEVAYITVDAHFGYYKKKIITDRIFEDIIRQYPDKKITLVGVSLGGFGSLALARRYPEKFEKVVLIAPYLGDKKYLQRVQQNDFKTREDDKPLTNELNLIWQFLLDKKNSHKLYLGYGEGDSFAEFYDYLSLYNSQLILIKKEGGHNWRTWREIWRHWLTQNSNHH